MGSWVRGAGNAQRRRIDTVRSRGGRDRGATAQCQRERDVDSHCQWRGCWWTHARAQSMDGGSEGGTRAEWGLQTQGPLLLSRSRDWALFGDVPALARTMAPTLMETSLTWAVLAPTLLRTLSERGAAELFGGRAPIAKRRPISFRMPCWRGRHENHYAKHVCVFFFSLLMRSFCRPLCPVRFVTACMHAPNRAEG